MPPSPTISDERYSVPYSQQLSSPNVGVADSKRWPALEVIYTNGGESERGDDQHDRYPLRCLCESRRACSGLTGRMAHTSPVTQTGPGSETKPSRRSAS